VLYKSTFTLLTISPVCLCVCSWVRLVWSWASYLTTCCHLISTSWFNRPVTIRWKPSDTGPLLVHDNTTCCFWHLLYITTAWISWFPVVVEENQVVISGTGCCGPIVLPVVEPTVSKHWRKLNVLMAAIVHCEPIKTSHYNIAHNFARCWLIFQILSLTDSPVNLQQNFINYPTTH